MRLELQIVEGRVYRRYGEDGFTPLARPRIAGSGATEEVSPLDALRQWSKRYALASVRNDHAALREIGSEMFAWLDTGNALSEWMALSERALQIVPDHTNSAPDLASRLLEAPWELLHHEDFLAQDPAQLFVVSRQLMPPTTPWTPAYGDLRMMFMAAAPEGQSDLDFEREEVDIINATQGVDGQRPLAHLVVEESGALEFLAPRLNGSDGSFEVLHLSCHGDIVAPQGQDGQRSGAKRPILLLETAEGAAHEVSAPDLIGACQGTLPPLVFVSACRTAQRDGPDNMRGAAGLRRDGFSEAPPTFAQRDASDPSATPTDTVAEPYVLELVRGVANVLGWDGSVYDHDAANFATSLYGALSAGKTVPVAAAMARRDLLVAQAQNPQNGRHWHLARVYLGAEGGGSICNPALDTRDPPAPEPAFLDSENRIKVAGRDTFVGRRRTIQRAIATLRAGGHGLSAQGIGNLGKSSVAARIGARLTGHRTVAVVCPDPALGHGDAGARTIFGKMKEVVETMAADLPYGSTEAQSLRDQVAKMEADLSNHPDRFKAILDSLLAGPFKKKPIFLVLDDFEHALQKPTADAPIVSPRASLLDDLRAVFRAFAGPMVTSRLMVTCRYDFTVPDDAGHDLTRPFLTRLPMRPMTPKEQSKQWQARDRARKRAEGETATDIDLGLVERIKEVSSGNPGLQEVLTQPLLRGAVTEVEAALATVEAFLATGTPPPADEDVGDFFQRMTFEVYEGALDGTTRLALAVTACFSPGVPIPRAALEAGLTEVGIGAPVPALDKLLALGLLDDHGEQAGWPGMDRRPHATLNPLARPLVTAPLDEDAMARVAQAALPGLTDAWQHNEGHFPRSLRAVETCVQALRAPTPDPACLDQAAKAAVIFLFELSQDATAAVALAKPALARLGTLNHLPSAPLLVHTINAAERIGAVDLEEALLDAALTRDDIEDGLMAQLKGLQGDRLMRRGDLDGALRIREQEELPVYISLGDKRSIAITHRKIGDIDMAQGRLDAALVHYNTAVELVRPLDAKRDLAVFKGKIADILTTRGDLDGALRIREQEELPVYISLGDQRSIAITKGRIADILTKRGDLDGALRIREQEELPVYVALGDKHSIAVTKGQIADILTTRGDLDGALRIREQEELPVYIALGDKRSIAVTKGKIADILTTRGDLDGALKIREQEQLPVYVALGDKRSIAVTKGKIADILMTRGDLDGALALHLECLPIAEEMQALDSIVHVKFSCARIRLQRGDHEKGGIQPIFDDLDSAFRGALQLGRPDAIAAIGALLAQVLAMGGAKAPAHDVLDLVAQAHTTLNDEQGLAHVAELRALLGDRDDPDP